MNHPRALATLVILLAGTIPAMAQDDGFTMSARGLIFVDAGYVGMGSNPPGIDYNSGAAIRRAQLTLSGDFGGGWSYSLGGTLTSRGSQTGIRLGTYIEYQNENSLGFRAGIFSAPSGIAGNTSSTSEMMLERPSAATIGRAVAAGPTRASFTGFSQGPRHLVAVSYTAGGVGSGGRYEDQQGIVARAAWLAVSDGDVRWLIDGAISHVFKLPDTAGPDTGMFRFRDGPEMSIDVTRPLDTGNIDARSVTAWNLETGLTWQSAYLQGGYFHYGVARRTALPDPDFEGWYAQASWFLTGEKRLYNADTASFRPPSPASPLDLDGKGGGWGAFELTSRYSVVDLNFNALAGAGAVTGGRQTIAALGLNWFPNSNFRVALIYQNFRVNHPESPARNFSGDALVMRGQYTF